MHSIVEYIFSTKYDIMYTLHILYELKKTKNKELLNAGAEDKQIF